MRLLPTLSRIDCRPAAHLGRAGEDGAHDQKDKKLETGPFAHDFRLDPARVGVVDDDLALLRGGSGDVLGDFLDGVDLEEFGEIVSGLSGSVGRCGIGAWLGVGGKEEEGGELFTYRPCRPSWGLRALRRCALLCARGTSS